MSARISLLTAAREEGDKSASKDRKKEEGGGRGEALEGRRLGSYY